MKKMIALLFAIIASVNLVACTGEDTFGNGFIVGGKTDLTPDMMAGWSNDAMNVAIWELLDGYATFEIDKEGTFLLNEIAVKSYDISENDDGSKTYTYTLNDNLKWNDGSKISASDYVFSILFGSSAEFGQLDGANNTAGYSFVGYDDFNAGNTKTFSGINLIDEDCFSITAKAEEFPFYYEEYLMRVSPMPMAVIAPNAMIVDDGNGATLTGDFSVESLRKTVLDTETGYRYNPKVTAGPYEFVSFDENSLQAVLQLNDEFLGRAGDGAKGTIEKLVLKKVVSATQLDEIKSKTVHLITDVAEGQYIVKALDMADEGVLDYVSYPRAGYGMLSFSCEFGPTQFTAVRQAIAYCLDRVTFADTFTEGYGQLTHANYGLSQWEAQESVDFFEENLNPYTFNIESAKNVLVEDGWILNENGEEFVEGKDEIRYKDVDGELMPLVIEWASSENNSVSDLIKIMLPQETLKVGMKINQTVMDTGTLFNHLNRLSPDLAKYHMFNLGTGFIDVNYAWYYSNPDPAFFGIYNRERITDDELYSIALDMKSTQPGDKDEWLSKWRKYQVRYNELVVNLPLYSNEFFEVFNPALKNYNSYALWSWQDAILRAELEK